MRAAINALCITNRSGTGRYAFGLIDGLIHQRFDELELTVFIPAEFTLPMQWKNSNQVRFFAIPTKRAFHRIAWEQLQLPKLVKKLKLELLHSLAFVSPAIFQPACCNVVTIHDLAFLKRKETIPALRRFYLRWATFRSISTAGAIITDSATVAGEIRQLELSSTPIHSVHLAVDPCRFTPEPSVNDNMVLQQRSIPENYFLFVGTIEPRKNLRTIVKAFNNARNRGLKQDLVIVGRAGWHEDINALKSPGIHFAGYVPDEEIPALYRNAEALIAPSTYEGFDLPVAEALACGTHVLASDIAVHRELLGEKIKLFTPDETNAWHEAFLNFDTNTNEILPPFNRSWADVAKETYRIYESLMEGIRPLPLQ